MKKIILFNPAYQVNYIPQAPLALLAVSSLLDRNKYEIKIINETVDYDCQESILKECRDAVCLGITAMTGYQISRSLEIASAVRKENPSLPIIWGGWHASILPDQTIQHPLVDVVVRGQGERAFKEIVDRIEEKKSFDGILGVTYKENGQVKANDDRPMEDVNNFPCLPYDLIDVSKCFNTSVGGRTLTYVSSRGCPHRCGFCADALVNKRKWKGLTAERILDDISYLVEKFNIDAISFSDSNFFVDKERARKFCQGLIDRKLNIKWGYANGRVPHLLTFDDSLWRLVKQTGCTLILVGAESGDQEMLDLIKKDASVEDTLKLSEICNKYGIMVSFSLMFGLPPIDKSKADQQLTKELKATVNLLYKILSQNRNHDVKLFFYTPYPGSPLYDLSLQNGLNVPESLEQWGEFDLDYVNTPWISKHFKDTFNLIKHWVVPFYQRHVSIQQQGRGKIRRLLGDFYEKLSEIRMKHFFFTLPLEYKLFELYVNSKKA